MFARNLGASVRFNKDVTHRANLRTPSSAVIGVETRRACPPTAASFRPAPANSGRGCRCGGSCFRAGGRAQLRSRPG